MPSSGSLTQDQMALAWGLGPSTQGPHSEDSRRPKPWSWQTNPIIPPTQAYVQRRVFSASLNQSCCQSVGVRLLCISQPLLSAPARPHVEDELHLSIPRLDHLELASCWPSAQSSNFMQISSAPAHQQDLSA